MVERTLYKYLVKQLNSAWELGVKYHLLGYGLLTFYPCIAFFCGDDPCQHRISGLRKVMPLMDVSTACFQLPKEWFMITQNIFQGTLMELFVCALLQKQ